MVGSPPGYVSSWLDVNLDVILHNYRYIVSQVAPATIIAVVKANSTGHGSRVIARMLQDESVRMLAVSNFMEGLDLRKHGITSPLLVMNGLLPEQMEMAIKKDMSFFGYDAQAVMSANEIARRLRRKARVHLKVDTGLGRLGVLPADVEEFARVIKRLDWLYIEGVASHMASANRPEHDDFSRMQCDLFEEACEVLDPNHKALRHLAASAAVLRFPTAYCDAVRFQSILYGLNRQPLPWPLKQAAQFKTRVVQVKNLPAGHNVGYGLRYTCNADARVAVIPVGTADGLTPEHSTEGLVLLRGKRCRIIGAYCCQSVLDTTNIPDVAVGDEVVLIGEQGGDSIGAAEFAALGRTTYTCLLTAQSLRNPRIYSRDGKVVAVEVYSAPLEYEE